jgi:hypothetical protein
MPLPPSPHSFLRGQAIGLPTGLTDKGKWGYYMKEKKKI